MNGAIDLFSGSSTITGTNLFQIDHSPLNELSGGIQDVIGKQGNSLGGNIISSFQAILDAILGLPPGTNILPFDTSTLTSTITTVETYFGNLEKFLGNLNPLDPNFATNLVNSATTFITDILKPTNLVALLSTDLTGGTGMGVTGVIPLENLAIEALSAVVGGAQSVIDAIMATVGWPAGSAQAAQVNQYFTDLLQMLNNPLLAQQSGGTFDPIAAVESFLTGMVKPTNILTSYDLWLTAYRTGQNLVLDPSFETQNASVWPGVVGAITTDQHHTGGHSMSLTSTGTLTTGHMTRTIVAPVSQQAWSGTIYKMGAWVFSKVGNSGQGHVKLVAHCSDSMDTDPPTDVIAQELALTTTGQWTQMSGMVTVPATYDYDTVDFWFVVESDVPSGDVLYLDDIGVWDTTQAQALIDTIVNALGIGGSLNSLETLVEALQNFPAANIVGVLAGSVIPGLDATKIISGVFSVAQIPLLAATQIVSGVFNAAQIPLLDASKIGSGQFAQSMVVNLEQDLANLGGELSTDYQNLITAITDLPSGTNIDVQNYFNSLESMLGVASGLFTSLPFNPVTAVTNFINNMLAPTNLLPIMNPVSKLINSLNIPGLDASKITSGQFAQSMVNLTNIPASIVTGILGAGQIPGLDATKIISGVFTTGQIPNLDASKIVSGVFSLGQIPFLPASQITSGQFVQSLIPSLTAAWSGTIAGSLINSVLNATVIPGLDASKIISGQFAQSMVNLTNIPASIVSGVLNAGQIPGLDASKIISGVFGVGQIPGLDASQIVSGQFPQWILPLVPVGSVGQTTPNLLANPNYAQAISVNGGGVWTWDGSTDHTGDGSGSVVVTATGALKQLNSDPATPVSQGQTLNCSHWLTWSGVTGSGACFQLILATYLAGSPVGQQVLQTISSPVTNSAWTQLSGSYTIPAGVDSVRLQLNVLPACTAGTIHWDDGSITKTQLLAESWTAGLTGDLSNLNTAVLARALQTDVISLVNSLGLGSYASIPAAITPITNRFANLPASGLFNSAFLGNIANIPLLPAVAIPGLDATKIISGQIAAPQIPNVTLPMSTDLQGLNDYVTNTLIGVVGLYSGTSLLQSNSSMGSLYNNMLNNTQSIQAMQSIQQGTSVSGMSASVDFNNYPDGPMPAMFTLTYQGAGTSQVAIKGGLATWNPLNNDANRKCWVIYNTQPTQTDFQRVNGSMNSAPSGSNSGGQPYQYALGRVDNPSNPQNYVWGRAYCTGFLTYKADLGYTSAGVETVWVTGIALTWSTSMSVVFGAVANARRYQVFSGTQLVADYTEVGTNSHLGSGYRYWGALSTMCAGSGGAKTAGDVAGTSVSDNAPPTVQGSTFRATCLSTTARTISSGSAVTLPSGFWDTLSYCSSDLTWNGPGGILTVSQAGTYTVKASLGVNNIPNGAKMTLYVGHNSTTNLEAVCGTFADSYLANSPNVICGSTNFYCNAGDTLQVYVYCSSNSSVVGDPSGSLAVFQVALANRSMA